MKKTSLILFSLFITSVFAGCIAMGFWQLQRLEWKLNIIHTIESRLAAPALTIEEGNVPEEIKDEFTKVSATGTFLHDAELFMGARYYGKKLGYHVITPLKISDNLVILVNRGWIPQELKDRTLRPESLTEGKSTIEGLIRLHGGKTWFTPENDPKKNIWFWRDIPAMTSVIRETYGMQVQPIYILALGRHVRGTLPIVESPNINIRNDHREYAITWFMLAAVTLIMFLFFLSKAGVLHKKTKA